MAWKAVVNYAIGTSHEQSQMPCQDYGYYVLIDTIIVGAVADGAGSAKYSDIGAELAVNTALSYLERLIERYQDTDWRQTMPEEGAKNIFGDTLKKVIDTLSEEANNNYKLSDLACTLLVFIAAPKWIAAMQVGDGFIVVKPQDSDYKLLFQPDKGEHANETTFVTSTNAQSQMRVRVLPGNQKFIFASTDGLERLAIDTRNWKPSAGFFQPFEEGLETRSQEQEAESTRNWLNSDDVNARTDDDKTLLFCLYQEDQPPPSLPHKKDRDPSELLMLQIFIFNLLAGFFCNFQYYYLFRVFKKVNIVAIGWVIVVTAFFIAHNFITFKLHQEYFRKHQEKLFFALVCLIGIVVGTVIFCLLFVITKVFGN